MKSIILLTCLFALNTHAQISGVCEALKRDVAAVISGLTIADNGQTFCFATELSSTKHYPVPDCGHLKNGTLVRGSVRTFWTHNDQYGRPVCDYQEFVIERL